MKIISTSDWHLGNLFHGNDRLDEHKHFLSWLLNQISIAQPDVLLVAGDIYDNGNPSAKAQEAYYRFLTDATRLCSQMHIVIIAGNHDSASRLEAPRALLSMHNIEVRGEIPRVWSESEKRWLINFDELVIPINSAQGEHLVVLAVPYLRNDIVQNANYSQGVNAILHDLTNYARAKYPNWPMLMMAHMYAKGADIAKEDASEKIIVGGQEEVSLSNWPNHPDYFTCGHIHKRQRIWGVDWARYTGSVLPMSFAEKDYSHGVDFITINSIENIDVQHIIYTPQHPLLILPEGDEEISPKKLAKLLIKELPDRTDGKLNDNAAYVLLKVAQDNVSNDEIKELEDLFANKNAVLCRIQKINHALNIHTLTGDHEVQSVDEVLNRDPMETLREAFAIKHGTEMNEQQVSLLSDLLSNINTDEND